MLSSIHPLGERTRNNRWGLTAVYYLAGGLMGGLVLGTVAGTIGWLGLAWWNPTPTSQAVVIVTILAIALLWDLSGLTIPTIHRQVNEDWLSMYRSWVYGGGFGFQLGLGVVTIVTTTAVYAMIALAILSAQPLTGAVDRRDLWPGAWVADPYGRSGRLRRDAPHLSSAHAIVRTAGRLARPFCRRSYRSRGHRRLVVTQISDRGITVDLPAGWEADFYRRSAAAAPLAEGHAPEVTTTIAHFANWPLPERTGRFRWRCR